MEDVLIIGAGAVGCFIARSLSRYELQVLVLEKENDVGDVTSMANSAIAHSGYDPEPGTNKAKFNVLGNKMMPEVCQELDVSFGKIGTLTVAVDDDQVPLLADLLVRAHQNGVEAKILTPEEVKALEPHINPAVKGALLCPTGGIVDPFTFTSRAMENACDNGVKLHLAETVLSVAKEGDHYTVKTDRGSYEAKVVVNAAGLHADEIAAMIEPVSWKILPRKGEYFVLNHFAPGLVNHVLFPLPSAKGKGVLVTQTTSGNYLVGPSSEFIGDKGDLATDVPTLESVKAQAQSLIPSLPFGEQIRVFSGIRATPSTHDFIIEASPRNPDFINVAGIESPGLVSSPAIGEYVVKDLIGAVLPLIAKASYKKAIKKYIRPLSLSLLERNALIQANPDYGEMVCDCEKVTLGEIKEALSRSVPCLTVKALKKRTRVGFGKCQGGFCQPKVVRLLADYYHISPLEVLYDKSGSAIILDEIKKEAK
jgi:glycerol-3-phosphate dehydrogenase